MKIAKFLEIILALETSFNHRFGGKVEVVGQKAEGGQ